MIQTILNYLLEHWDSLGLPVAKPHALSFIEIAGMRNFPGKALFLIFSEEAKIPVLFVKVSRFQIDNTTIEREYTILQYLHRECANTLITSSIPKPLLYETIGEHAVLVTDAFRGHSINRFKLSRLLFQEKDTRYNCSRVTDWLLRFHHRMKISVDGLTMDIKQQVENTFESFLNIFALSPEEMEFADTMNPAKGSIFGKESALYFKHGDFVPGNIFDTDSGIKVLDWEYARKDYLPMHDLLFFFIWYSFDCAITGATSGDKLTKLQEAFFTDTWYSRLVKEQVLRYCRALSIDPTCMPWYFFMLLLSLSVDEYTGLLKNRNSGYMAMFKGYTTPIQTPSADVIRDGLYINLLRIFIKRNSAFVLRDMR